MNDNFSFDGADAADMPLDLSFSSLPLPEGEAAAGFHLPEMEPGTNGGRMSRCLTTAD